MDLRPYQETAVASVLEEWEEHRATLLVLPTGTGKTVVFSKVIQRAKRGRAAVFAHREELIYQARRTIEAATNLTTDIEKAGEWAAGQGAMYGVADVVIGSIQTQIANWGTQKRMHRFNPGEFGVCVIDEAHHTVAPTYREVLRHYESNPDLRILGVTATPDRKDEKALGQIYGSVAMCYEIDDAIRDGWLVPIRQYAVHVNGLDYSVCRTTAGDLNAGDLAQVLEYEAILHGFAEPTIRLTKGRTVLVFCVTLAHAERLCEIFNRYEPGCARWISGKTPSDERQRLIRQYEAREFRILCNVGVATEGFDAPHVEAVVLARPTKARSLYAQMVGRGTRPRPGVVDGPQNAEQRRFSISCSAKPNLTVIDFVGNSGRHKLMTSADILGGKYSEEVVEDAKRRAERSTDPLDMMDELELAQERALAEERERVERERRARVRARVRAKVVEIDPFAILDIAPAQSRGWDAALQPTRKQIDFLRRNKIEDVNGMTRKQATQVIGGIMDRWATGQCTYKQARVLHRYGYRTDVSMDKASSILDRLAANKWKPLAEDPTR